MRNFWTQLHKPFKILAPMYDVTDEAFRQMFVKYGQPDVFFTEFVSVDGLVSEAGRPKVSRELYFQPNEHPIVAQVFGYKPEKFFAASQLIAAMGFDGIDINMGCPDKTILKQGAGAALIKKPELAAEIIEATQRGAPDLPVSVKTRIGYSSLNEFEPWIRALLAAKPALITLHLRTMKEMSLVPAHWELAGRLVELAKGTGVLTIANGDVKTLTEANEKAAQYGLDGVMVGRGAFGNPWFYSGHEPSATEKLRALREHIEIFADLYLPGAKNEKLFGGHTKNFSVMKKHFKAYVSGWSGAVPLRQQLMDCDTPDEALKVLSQHLS